ncbi:MAG TPA: cellulose binding domain-containing protein [Actinospica sp.]|nr:cellulose binding domain-containing protein [Actinospica sp.]
MGAHASPAPQEQNARRPRAPRFSRRAKLTAIGAGATLAVAGGGLLLATGANAAVPAAAFTESSAWDGGYTGQYTITNTTGAAISSWKVVFALPSGSTVDSLWNGAETASGQTYTVANADWNGTLAAGASTSFGFTVNGTGEPVGCTINGSACGGTGTPTASASASKTATAAPSASATATKTATSSPTATATATSTGTGSSGGGTSSGSFGKFSPYTDLSLYPLYNLSAQASTEGTKYFNLAFVTAGSNCTPEWGGVTAINDSSISGDIASLRAAGGDVRVSFGGEAGTELAQSCTSASSLAAAYQSVVKQYSLTEIDFDVEGAAIADTNSINLRNQAIATLEQEDPGLQVSYTLPVLPSGLTSEGVAVLANAKADGAGIAAVNVMAMDYGSSFPGDMATLAEQAATATMKQVQSVWTNLSTAQAYAKIAVTPMIGVNDDSAETFTVADASSLASFAKTNGLAWLAMWSATRDSECSGGAQTFASATCSSVVQSAGAFGQALSAF